MMEIKSLVTPVDIKKPSLVEKKKSEETLPQDTVTLGSSEPSMLRKGIEGLGGVIGGLKTAVTSILPGGIEGGLDAVDKGKGEGIAYGITKVIQSGLLGTGVALLIGAGPLAIAGLTVAGLVTGGVHVALMSGEKKLDKEVGENIAQHAHKAVADFVPSDDKIHDVTSNFIRGIPAGIHGGVESGWKVGKEEGKGAVSGLLEGAKGVGSVIAGKYEIKEVKEAKEEEKKEGSKIGKALRKLAEVIIGVPAGLVGSALFAPAGGIQGFVDGIELNEDYSNSPEKKLDTGEAVKDLNSRGRARKTNALVFLEALGLGAGVGAIALAGLPGILIGIGGAAVIGGLSYAVASSKDRTEDFNKGVSQAVVHAYSDNAKTDSTSYSLRRDVTEGTITGLAAGAREGFKEGYDVSKEVVDTVADGVAHVAKGAIKVVKYVAENVADFSVGMAKGTYEAIVKDKVE